MYNQPHLEQREDFRSLWKVAARVPWPALLACCLYLPGIVLWAVYSLRCKANTFLFLTAVAPVAQETVDAVTNTVNTTLFTLAAGGTFIFALLLLLAIARSIQIAGVAPNNCCPCARPTPSSYYLYRVFNMGFNIIVFFVNLAIMFLMMGAFLWLVVAFAANLSIKGGVRAAADAGVNPVEQGLQANQTYTTVVSNYQKQLQQTPACVANSTWLKELNSSISKILEPIPFITNGTLNATNGSAAVNTLLCPQTCLNLGSFATLFRLQQSCICSGEQLSALQEYSATVSADAGVCLAGVMLIYLACSTLHAYLIGQYVHAGYDYKAAKLRYADFIKQRRRQHALNGSVSNGSRKFPKGGMGAPIVPVGPMNGDPGSLDDDGVYLNAQDVEMGCGTKQRSMRRQLTDDISYVDQQPSDAFSHGHRGHDNDAAGRSVQRVSDDEQTHASAHPGSDSNLVHHSKQSSSSLGAAVMVAGQLGRSHSSNSNAGARGRLNGTYASAAAGSLHRSSPLKPAGSLKHTNSSPASGSLAAVASFNAWERSQQEQQPSPGGEPDAAAAGSKNLHQQGQLVGGTHAATGVITPTKAATIAVVHARKESKSSAGSIREILLGAVPLDTISSPHPHQQQPVQHPQPAGATTASGGFTTAPGRGSSDNSVGLATSSGVVATMGSFSGSRDGASHKPSSSGGSYESMIYHSPRNSDSGSNLASSGAHLATAAAAGGLLELTPFVANKSALHKRQHQQQQQQQAVLQHTHVGHWGGGRVADSIRETSAELPPVAEQVVKATASDVPAESAVQQARSAVGLENGIDTPSPSSDLAGNFYDTTGSKASSRGDTIGSLNSSGHRSRNSHRRLPAFDLTNTAHNFITVEGLEQQQQLERELGSRPSSPAVAAGAAASSADDSLLAGEMSAADKAGAAEDKAMTDVAMPGSAPKQLEVIHSEVHATAAVSRDWPDMSDGKVSAARAAKVDDASPAAVASGGGLSAPVTAVPLPVRRNISLPATLQLPSQDDDADLDLQRPFKVEQVSGQQQQLLRPSFTSPLLPPPEQQQLLLQHQQQQLALLLQQEDEQQWHHQPQQQQQSLAKYQRHWSTPTAAAVAAMSARSSISPSSAAYAAPFQLSTQLNPSGAFSAGASAPMAQKLPAVQQVGNGPAAAGAARLNGLDRTSGSFLGDESLIDTDSMYTTPEPSPVTIGVSASTPGSVDGLRVGHISSSSISTAGVAVPPLFVGGSSVSSLSASYSSVPGSSQVSSFTGGLTPIGGSTPRSIPGTGASSSSMGSPAGAAAGSQLVGNGAAAGSLGALGGLPPTIPEMPGAMYTVDSGFSQQQQQGSYNGTDVATLGSPLERRRSGYRSSMRKGLMAYDQYKHRQRYQQEVSSPLDPRTELSRRYRNRVPAV